MSLIELLAKKNGRKVDNGKAFDNKSENSNWEYWFTCAIKLYDSSVCTFVLKQSK